jgi:hypothetical protein
MGQLPLQGAEHLERFLDRVEAGDPTDYRSPLYGKETDRKDLIDLFEKDVGYTGFEEYDRIDQHEKDGVGPYAPVLPSSERLSSLQQYWSQHFHPIEEALTHAFDSVVSILPKRSLRPAGADTAYGLMPKDTNLGLPWWTRDRDKAGSYLDRAISLKEASELYPCVWASRTTPKGLTEIPKQRDVWAFDHADTILCSTILYPLLAALGQRPGFSAWLGDAYVDEEATKILSMSHGRRILSGDYSSFDSSLPRQMLDLVDDVLCEWFVDSVHARIHLLGEICATVPIVVPHDVLDGRNGAMPSGHGLTNMKDSIANLLAIHYAAFRLGVKVEYYMVLGDDFVVLFSEDIDLPSFEKVVDEIGLSANADKQYWSNTSIHYLQRWHSQEYVIDGLNVGCHSPYRTLSGLLAYERFRNPKVWNKYLDTSRWIMQAEVCHNDPRHKALCGFIYRGDDVLLSGMDPVTVFKRAGGAHNIRDVLSIASFPFNVKNPELVREFETTRVIREFQR